MANKRETIVKKCFDLVKAQNSVKLGKVERDPIIPEELAKTAFPAVYFETSNEDIEMLTGTQMRAELELAVVVIVGGEKRDTQRNIAIAAIEKTLMADRTLGNNVEDCRLTRVESITTGESAPFASCRMIFLVEYCYSV